MEVVVLKNYEQVSEYAFNKFKQKLSDMNGEMVTGFPTGSTPLGLYKKIAKSKLDLSKLITFNMDEYIGLGRDNKNSFYYFMNENLFSKVNISQENINIPNGLADDFEKECFEYEEKIKKSRGVDIGFGGVGSNGHIAFNEPGSSFSSLTRVVNLSKETVADNSRFFKTLEEVPKKAITIGIDTIMKTKELVFIASGKNKAKAVKEAVEGKVSEECPISILKNHNNALLIVDMEAGALI